MHLLTIVSSLICIQLISTAPTDKKNDVPKPVIIDSESTEEYEYAPRAAPFLRFGRSQPTFLRFGRSQPTFLRFGRQNQEINSNQFLRFGKKGEFLRFG